MRVLQNPQLSLSVKRAFDVSVSCTALTILSPALVLIAAAVRLTSPGPALFVQRRVGKDKHEFSILKFRTMFVGSAEVRDGLAVGSGDSRITGVGRILRKTSLDELPQFWNVLVGDLSIVGPRAALPEQLPFYSIRQRERFRMKPGITGLATVNGRCSIPWSERIEHDLRYIETFSIFQDVRIILKTLFVVGGARDTYFDNSSGPAFDLAEPDNLPQSGGAIK